MLNSELTEKCGSEPKISTNSTNKNTNTVDVYDMGGPEFIFL
jgi:hypothetical protein